MLFEHFGRRVIKIEACCVMYIYSTNYTRLFLLSTRLLKMASYGYIMCTSSSLYGSYSWNSHTLVCGTWSQASDSQFVILYVFGRFQSHYGSSITFFKSVHESTTILHYHLCVFQICFVRKCFEGMLSLRAWGRLQRKAVQSNYSQWDDKPIRIRVLIKILVE